MPAERARHRDEKGRAGSEAGARDGGPGLIICDDHPIVRDQLVTEMTGSGRFGPVRSAPDVASLISQVADEAPAVVVVDIELPDGDGLNAIERVAEVDDSVKTVILSAHADPELITEARRRGADGFVSKVEGGSGLLDVLEAVLEGGESFPGTGGGGDRIERLLSLSPREREILDLVADGQAADEIGGRLGISKATVYTHVRNATAKLGVRTRGEAIALSVRYSYLRDDG